MRGIRLIMGCVAVSALTFSAIDPVAPQVIPASLHFLRVDGDVDNSESFVPAGEQAIVGDFVGGAEAPLDDIFWYTPGPGGDALWRSRGDRSFASSPQSVSGHYTPLIGYFGDDHDRQDILWYAPGGASSLWDFNADGTITKNAVSITAVGQPLVGDFTGDGGDDVIIYAPGPAPEQWLDFGGDGTVVNRPISVNHRYKPLIGNFAGTGAAPADNATDILWYAPGGAPDFLWDFEPDGSIASRQLAITGDYQPIAGDFTRDGGDDILWYQAGLGPDSFWDFNADSSITKRSVTINGVYELRTCACFDTDAAHAQDLLFSGFRGNSVVWDFGGTDGATFRSRSIATLGGYDPVVGHFETGSTDAVLTFDALRGISAAGGS